MGSLSWEEAVLGTGGKIPALGEEILEEVCSSPGRTQAPAPRTAGDNGLIHQVCASRTSLSLPDNPAGLWLWALKPHCKPKKENSISNSPRKIHGLVQQPRAGSWTDLPHHLGTRLTFWHCRLGSFNKFISRSLLPCLHEASPSIFHHALSLPPPPPKF